MRCSVTCDEPLDTVNLTQTQISHAGYWGAMVLVLWIILGAFLPIDDYSVNRLGIHPLIFPLVAAVYVMVLYERFHCPWSRHQIRSCYSQRWRWRSAWIRYFVVLTATSAATGLVHSHYYFLSPQFDFTRAYYFSVFGIVLLFGLPYMLITLRLRGAHHYDLNDFSIILVAGVRGLIRAMQSWLNRTPATPHFVRIKNWRVRKVLLIYLANLFFLTLMTRFFSQEWSALSMDLEKINTSNFSGSELFAKYHAYYLTALHLIFAVDTGLALIAYTISTRWLNNRVKSIDTTLLGWTVALICYPPFNDAMSQFIGFGRFGPSPLVTNECAKVILMTLIIACLLVYLWATMALGFRFGNLVNRGIVTHGPYRYLRHPAYLTKNVSWWLDNTQVLTHPGATISLAAWSLIYWLRGKTEEKHLAKDATYLQYQSRCRCR